MFDYIFLIILIPVLFYYFYFLLGIYKGLDNIDKRVSDNIPGEFVSVIIPFRNESENILQSLKSIEEQNYPKDKFEVIYVNDSSTDDSLDKMESHIKSNNIRVLSVPKNFADKAHKKRAIRYGIENAEGKIIVTTDADCTHTNNWLTALLSGFDEETALISGPVEFIDKKGFFNQLQRLEFASLIITGAGLIGADKPLICNGANLAYRKSVFDEVGGFKGQMELSSGDDEILMQRIWETTGYKIKFCASRDAVSFTPANKNLEQFYNQRKRWASKGLFYELKSTLISIVFILLFYFFLFALLTLSFINTDFYLPIFISVFALKILFEFLIMKKGTALLFDKKMLKYFLPAEILHIPYILISGIAGIFGNYVWKERKLTR